MSGQGWRRWPALAGLAFVLLQLVMGALFFVGGAPPPLADAGRFAAFAQRDAAVLLTIGFVNGLSYTLLLVFAGGVRRLLGAHEGADAFATLFYGAAILSIVLNSVGGALIATAGLDAAARPEPAAVRALYESGGALIGVFALFPTALMLVAAAAGLRRARGLPRALVWIGYGAGLLNLAATPALYGGSDLTAFYSATGFAGIVMGLLPLLVWVAALSGALLRPWAAE